MSDPAVFLDRDDTLIVDSGFIDDPDKVRLVPGAAEAVKKLRRSGYKVVVASNQSGIARGMFDEARLDEIHDRLQALLAEQGAYLDGIYYCPYLDGPEALVDRYRCESDLRKPAPGMLLKAAKEMDLDLRRSWMIGDSARDIQAGHRAGCRTILIAGNGSEPANGDIRPTECVVSLSEAADIVQRVGLQAPPLGASANVNRAATSEVARGAAPSSPTTSESLLTEIRDLLARQRRDRLQDDFSLARLMATLMQMLAVFMAVWGVLALLGDNTAMTAVARFSLAVFLQLAIVTIRLGDPRR